MYPPAPPLRHPRTKVAVDSVPAAAPVAGVFRCPARRLPAFLRTDRDPLPLWEALVAPHRFDLLPGGAVPAQPLWAADCARPPPLAPPRPSEPPAGGRTMAAPEDGSAAPLPALCCRIAYEEPAALLRLAQGRRPFD